MKKILICSAIALVSISAFFFTGCYKQTEYQPSMAGTIDSISFSAAGKGIDSKFNGDTVFMKGTTTVFTPGTTFTPAVKLVTLTSIGKHPINKDASAIVYTSVTGSIGSAAVSGEIEVLNNANGKVQGNFNFKSADGTTVTGGHFTTNR